MSIVWVLPVLAYAGFTTSHDKCRDMKAMPIALATETAG